MEPWAKPTESHLPKSGLGWSFHTKEDNVAAPPGEEISDNAYTPLAANAKIEALSSDAGDTTQSVVIIGVTAAGVRVSETLTLNGVTAVTTTGTFHSVETAYLNAKAAGTITIRAAVAGATVSTITIGSLRMNIAHHFIDASKRCYITDFIGHATTVAETIEHQLRYYPKIVDARGSTVGFVILDRIYQPAAIGTTHLRYSIPLACPFVGGFIAVLSSSPAAAGDAAVTVIGYDA